MSAGSPQELHTLFVTRVNAADLEGVLSLYEDGATYVSPDGSRVAGLEEIETLLGHLIAGEPSFENTTDYVIEGEGVALMSNSWTAVVSPPGGEPVQMSGKSIEVARRQPDGSWRYVIDAPASLT